MVVGRRHVAVGLEDARDPRAGDETARQRQIERRQRQCLVVDDFDRGAAVAEDDDGPEGRIVGEADDQLARIRAHDHRKHGDAVDSRSGLAARARLSMPPWPDDGLRGDETEQDAADIRLVDDIGRRILENHRVAGGESGSATATASSGLRASTAGVIAMP